MPAYSTNAVDPTGAGDAYAAGIIYGYLQGLELEQTMRLASYIASSKCEKPGARAGLPYKEDIVDWLDSLIP